ncbi:MAG: hypothetical protein HQK77_03290 [Desulfobacterales bacterium]|nr:hypothetical protein [Desulfobacterales bacterium]
MLNYLYNFTGSLCDEIFLTPARIYHTFKPAKPVDLEAYETQMDDYVEKGFVDNPIDFFELPTHQPSFEIREHHPYQQDGEFQLISYTSDYIPKNSFIRDRFLSYHENRTGYLVRWHHTQQKYTKTIVCLHGYMLGEPSQAEKMFKIQTLFSAGLDVVLFISPFHWKRNSGKLYDRGMFLQADDVVMTAECFGQAMHDLRISLNILRQLGSEKIGLIGASLGGYLAALYVSLCAIPYFAALMVPAVDFSHPFGTETAKFSCSIHQTCKTKMAKIWTMHSPLHFVPKIPTTNMLFVAFKGDRVCPFTQVQSLAQQWQCNRVHFLDGGHWVNLGFKSRGRVWYQFLKDMEFI